MILIIVMLSALVTRVSPAPLCNNTAVSSNSNTSAPFNSADPAIQLYNSVIIGDYGIAVETTFNLKDDCKADVIRSVVKRLLLEEKTNIVEYAYSLWYRFGERIVINYFPIEFWLLFKETPVMLINKRDELALKMELTTSNNIVEYMAKSADSVNVKHPLPSVSWKIFPIWNRNKVYFTILNLSYNKYLNLETKTEYTGELKAFGSYEEDTWRHEWYFQPVVYDKQILFSIHNRQYKYALKLANTVDDYGNRHLQGDNGDIFSNPEEYGWHIAPF